MREQLIVVATTTAQSVGLCDRCADHLFDDRPDLAERDNGWATLASPPLSCRPVVRRVPTFKFQVVLGPFVCERFESAPSDLTVEHRPG